ncbi:uncharacterized protein [Panulirus ornatus]|uniref:uncharacterized protein isoform X2 n=1 Tax=Panulirus ornatus TaxID=150431 RepID=UPI003A8C6E53
MMASSPPHISSPHSGGGPSGGKPLLNSLSDAVADILGPESPSIIGISGLTCYDSVTDDSFEDTTRTCTIMTPPPQSSQESQPSASMLIHRPTSVDWGQPMTKKAIDLKITELQSNIEFHNAQMEVARAQVEAARAQMELQKTKIELAKEQLQKYHEMKEECT